MLATENRGFAAANNRGLEVVDADWVLFLNPDTRILAGSLEELVSRLAGAADGRARRCPTDRRERGDGSDDAPFPERRSLALSEPRRERLPFLRLVARRARARPQALRPRKLLRLDRRVVHARAQRLRSTTSGRWTSGSSSTARRRTSACGCTRPGWEVVHLPQMTILHQSSTTGRREAERADGVRAAAVHEEALLASSPTGRNCRARPRLCAPRHQAGPVTRSARRRRASARSRPLDARRAGAAAFHPSDRRAPPTSPRQRPRATRLLTYRLTAAMATPIRRPSVVVAGRGQTRAEASLLCGGRRPGGG